MPVIVTRCGGRDAKHFADVGHAGEAHRNLVVFGDGVTQCQFFVREEGGAVWRLDFQPSRIVAELWKSL